MIFNPVLLTSLAGVLLLNACATTPEEQAPFSENRDADSLLTVDCLLPGRVRKLGQGRVYQEPPHPIKAPATMCEIRGGDYVLHDRADFRTSLSVWLDSAQAGDAQAQTYVGEIFEKGMGIEADYAEAARWYQLAAEQGFERAMINLGYLYEAGLGVEKDLARALNLYRDAAGLSDSSLEYVSQVEVAERKKQRIVLQQTQAELEQSQKALLRAEADYQDQQNQLLGSQRELRALQQAVDKQQVQLASELAAAVAQSAPSDEAMQAIDTLGSDLATARETQQDLEAQLIEQRRANESLKTALSDLQQRQSVTTNELSTQARAEQARLEAELADAEEQQRDLQRTLAAQNTTVLDVRHQLTQQSERYREDIETLQLEFGQSAAESQAQLEAMQVALAEQKRQVAELTGQLAEREQAVLDSAPAEDLPKADTISQVAYDGLRIELISLETRNLRSGQLVADLTDPLQREIVGQVLPVKQLDDLQINQQVQDWDELGLFTYQRVNEDKLDIVARDAGAKRYRRLYNLRTPATALSENGVGDDSENSVVGTLPGALASVPFGNYHALIVGNSDYQYLSGVEHAVNDAKRLESVLNTRFGFRTKLLLNASGQSFVQAIQSYQQTLTETDNFVLFYSGHCKQASAFSPGYWLPVDAGRRRDDAWLSIPSLIGIIDAMSARHVLVIADACFSQTLTSTAVPLPGNTASVNDRVQWYETMLSRKVRSVLTSGATRPWTQSGDEYAVSPFTTALVDALELKDTVIEGSRLYSAIRQAAVSRFRPLLASGNINYAPIRHAGHEAGEFLFTPVSLR